MSRSRPHAADETPLPTNRAFAGLTVREYVAILFPERPRRALDTLFASGRIRSEGTPVAATKRVGELGDLTLVGGTDDLPEVFRARDGTEIPVVHEDERFTVLAKPAGVPVTPDRESGRESCLGFLLERELEARRGKPLEEWIRPRIMHRIDRATSGLLVTARTSGAERELGRAFEERRVEKEYLARLSGVVEPAKISVHCPVGPGRKGKMRAGPGGKPALTDFEVLERFRDATLVVAKPQTGRMHQIRVHARAMGHPVVGDRLYGRVVEGQPDRLVLHAWRYAVRGTDIRFVCAPGWEGEAPAEPA